MDKVGDAALEKENASKEKWLRGEYRSYVEWMKDSISFLKKNGLNRTMFENAVREVEYTAGLKVLFDYLNNKKIITCIISGAFRELARPIATQFHVDHTIAACECLFSGEQPVHADYFPSD